MASGPAQAARHPPVDDIRDLLTFRIAMLGAAGDRLGQDWLLREYGLRLQEWRVLGLAAAMAPVRFGEVARTLLIDKGRLSRVVKGLVGRGLLEAGADEEDARTLLLRPSAAGARLHDRVLAGALDRNQRVLAALSPAEARTLFALLDRLQPYMANRAGMEIEGEIEGETGT